jgi:hypothetical protein
MSGIMNPEPQVSRHNGPPPPPLATQGPNSAPPPHSRGGNNSYSTRPDLNMGRNNSFEDGINIKENFSSTNTEPQSRRRPEMKGPSDISDILSGIKTKTINVQESKPQQQPSPLQNNDSSTISISDLKDLQTDGTFPKKSKRRQKSASNTISLDI